MILYEVRNLTDDDYGCYEVFARFSTYEQAEELVKKFEGFDGFGICKDYIHIVKVEIILDKIEDFVFELLEDCKRSKRIYEEKYGAD